MKSPTDDTVDEVVFLNNCMEWCGSPCTNCLKDTPELFNECAATRDDGKCVCRQCYQMLQRMEVGM